MSTDPTSAVTVERAEPATLDAAIPLLESQLREHGIDTATLGEGVFVAAIRGLVAVPGRGAVLLARCTRTHSVVGVAVLAHTWTIELGGLATWLDELYVVPERRGEGIGTVLLRRAIAVAAQHGCRAIDLEVDVEHARVEGLYEREGFRPFRRRHFTRSLLER